MKLTNKILLAALLLLLCALSVNKALINSKVKVAPRFNFSNDKKTDQINVYKKISSADMGVRYL